MTNEPTSGGNIQVERRVRPSSRRMDMEWIKCSEKMPKPCVPVIAWFDNGSYPIWAYHNEGEWRATLGMKHLDFQEYEITHWMPFEPPTERE